MGHQGVDAAGGITIGEGIGGAVLMVTVARTVVVAVGRTGGTTVGPPKKRGWVGCNVGMETVGLTNGDETARVVTSAVGVAVATTSVGIRVAVLVAVAGNSSVSVSVGDSSTGTSGAGVVARKREGVTVEMMTLM